MSDLAEAIRKLKNLVEALEERLKQLSDEDLKDLRTADATLRGVLARYGVVVDVELLKPFRLKKKPNK